MIISSTEFQQRVGHYFSLAAQGMEIFVEKRKPKKIVFQLVVQPERKKVVSKNAQILAKIKARNMTTTEHDGVAFQRRVRS